MADEYIPYQGGLTIDEFIDSINTELTIALKNKELKQYITKK